MSRDGINGLAVDVLRKALAWRVLLDSGQVANQAEIARREGVTRARVTLVMGLLRLAPEIRQHILSMPETDRRPTLTQRVLRTVARCDREAQLAEFRPLLEGVE